MQKKIPINQAESDHHTSSSKDNKVILNIFFLKQIICVDFQIGCPRGFIGDLDHLNDGGTHFLIFLSIQFSFPLNFL